MNLFNLSIKDAEKELDKILNNITAEELLEELNECGYKKINNIKHETNNSLYIRKSKKV